MKKVWLHTFWLAFGPVRPSNQSTSDRQPLLQGAWLRSVAPPYYHGRGVAVRLGENTLSIGVCYPKGRITLPDTDGELLEAVFGRRVDQEQEGTWPGSDERSA